MLPRASLYLPRPPVIAMTLSCVSKKGPSTVIAPPFRKLIQVHSHEPSVVLIRMQLPWSRPTLSTFVSS